MNHRTLEKELTHLEYVLARLSANDVIPLVYWRNRVAALTAVVTIPGQRTRLKRLNETLQVLEASFAALGAKQQSTMRRVRRMPAANVDHNMDQWQIAE